MKLLFAKYLVTEMRKVVDTTEPDYFCDLEISTGKE